MPWTRVPPFRGLDRGVGDAELRGAEGAKSTQATLCCFVAHLPTVGDYVGSTNALRPCFGNFHSRQPHPSTASCGKPSLSSRCRDTCSQGP